MGRTVSQSRPVDTGVTVCTQRDGVMISGPLDLRFSPGYGTTQATTSYRSGGAGVKEDPFAEEDSDYSEGGVNSGQAIGRLQSEGHRTVSRSTYDNGHEFDTLSTRVIFSHVLKNMKVVDGSQRHISYSGPVQIDPAYFSYTGSPWIVPDLADTAWYGTRAIANTLPTNPIAGLSVAVAELKREGIPNTLKLLSSQKQAQDLHSNAAGLFLEGEFGWKPLVSEAIQAAMSVKRANKHITQYIRDSGRNVRRKYAFPIEYKTLASYPEKQGRVQLISPLSSTNDYFWLNQNQWGSQHESITQERRVWFSGAYTYHAIEGNNLQSRLGRFEQEAQKLLGIRITPEVLWNLQPWSWLIDWKANIGDVIHNISAFSSDGLVLRYGYLMVETITRHTVVVVGPKAVGLGSLPSHYTVTYELHRKQRVKATPYGFGLNPASFSAGQWSILAALGLSKSPNSLS